VRHDDDLTTTDETHITRYLVTWSHLVLRFNISANLGRLLMLQLERSNRCESTPCTAGNIIPFFVFFINSFIRNFIN